MCLLASAYLHPIHPIATEQKLPSNCSCNSIRTWHSERFVTPNNVGKPSLGKKSDLAGDWTYHPKASWLIKPKLVERRARKHLSTKKSLLCHSLLLCKWCYSTYGNLLRSCHCYFQTNRHFCYQSYSCVPPEERMSGKMLILWTQLRCKVYAVNPLDLSPVFTVLLTIVWFAPVVGWYHIFWFQSYSE